MAALEDELSSHRVAAFGWALACCRGDRFMAEDVLQNAYVAVLPAK